MPFELTEENINLVGKRDRLKEERVVCDLDFEYRTDYGVLAEFAPDLKAMLFCKAPAAQGELVADADHMPGLHFPQIKQIKWEGGDVIGGELTFHIGVSGKGNVVFPLANVTRFRFEPQIGGFVVVRFRATVKPTEAQAGKLSRFLEDGEVQVSLTAPGK